MKYLLILLLVFLGCKSTVTDNDTVNTEPVEGTVKSYDDLELSYIKAGKGDTTIILLHGWCIDKSYWNKQINFLSDSYQVIALDHAGHGKSGKDRTEWTVNSLAKDVITLIDSLKLKKNILVGHSMSGEIMLDAYLSDPTNIIGLIGIDNMKDVSFELNEENKAQLEGFYASLENEFYKTTYWMVTQYLFPPSADSILVSQIANDMASADSVMAVSLYKNLIPELTKTKDKLPEVKVPVVLINSSMRPTDIESMNSYCASKVTLFEIDSIGHYPMNEVPEQFNTLLLKGIQTIGKL